MRDSSWRHIPGTKKPLPPAPTPVQHAPPLAHIRSAVAVLLDDSVFGPKHPNALPVRILRSVS